MKKAQIKELAQSIVSYDGITDETLNWILSKLNRSQLKIFLAFLTTAVKNKNVNIFYAGEISQGDKDKVFSLFSPEKKFVFIKDDESVVAGVRIEYGDFVLDYSVAQIVKRILSSIRESI
ncbi:MAG: hypothetical protein LBC07_00850 [Elusimicrobiota bacterium]|jgi:F0F1-type ATP synthase delta subunit|nr:hypothetical protein [Elusimicrobiota bacterium]